MTPLSHIARHARERPEALAALDDGVEVTWRALWSDVVAAHAFLRGMQVPRGRLIGIHLASDYETCLTLMAAHLAGLPAACLQGKFLPQLRKLNAARLLTDDPQTLAHTRSGAVPLKKGWLRDLPRAGGVDMPEYSLGDDDLVLISVTSGTTGKPKRIPGSRRHMESRVATIVERYAGFGATRYLNLVTPAHTGGYANILAVWQLGGTVIFERRMHPAQAIVEHEPDEFRTFPALMTQILERLPPDWRPHKRMRVRLGGSRLTPALYAAVVERLGATIEESYGSTETQTIAFGTAPGELAVAPWCTAEVVDANDALLPLGETGLLRVRTPGMAGTYLDDPELAAKHWRKGWFYSGDMAVFTAPGKFRLVGRESDMLNLGGVKVPAATIEERVAAVPGVREAAAFSVPNAAGIEELWVAIVTGSSGTPKREVLQAAMGKLAKYGRVSFLVLPSLPRNEGGKVVRRSLVEQARRRS